MRIRPATSTWRVSCFPALLLISLFADSPGSSAQTPTVYAGQGAAPTVTAVDPASGPADTGTFFDIAGTDFVAGATVTVGGVSATDVIFINPTGINATTPVLSPGTLNDVVVTNPDMQSGTLTNGWVADFLDVPEVDIFHEAVVTIFRFGITVGCGGGNYCRDAPVTRAQMAVFLLKAMHGSGFTPPACVPPGIFPDVPCPGQFTDWIEELFAEGITAGCPGGNYCPNDPVLRQQMAVFLLKASNLPGYLPPACAGIFDDVPCPSQFADWIEELDAQAITGGCQVSPPLFCPTNPNTRGQMAAFLFNTFFVSK